MRITEAKVMAMVKRYKVKLDLHEWALDIGFSTRNTNYYAKTDAQPDYMKAYITFNLHRIDDLKTLRKVILHEFCHVWLSPYTRAAKALLGKKARRVLFVMEETLATKFERWEAWHK